MTPIERNIPSLIESLAVLGELLLSDNVAIAAAKKQAEIYNPWFTSDHIELQLNNIAKQYLDKTLLTRWITQYAIPQCEPKNVGIIMAGNIPMVGFHDLLCTWCSGHIPIVKLSEKDRMLFPIIYQEWKKILATETPTMHFVDKMPDVELLLATGSDNTKRHLDYYFSATPRLIRDSRSSVAVLDSDYRSSDMERLMDDIFLYFGLGCRNVAKVYLPHDFDLNQIFEHSLKYRHFINHTKYKNNYDYNKATLILDRVPYHTNDLIIIKEDKSLTSRIATLHIERYSCSAQECILDLRRAHADQLQCIATNIPNRSSLGDNVISLGESQEPTLWDYADSKDVMTFLLNGVK